MKKLLGKIILVAGVIGTSAAIVGISHGVEDAKWNRICDGTTITEQCQDEEGIRYSKFLFHEAEAEKTKEVIHPAEPEKTHVVHHPAEYGTRQVKVCIKTTIGYKNGTCALSLCRDGEYSGSTGRGTCSYHGGVARKGGPWYEYITETYLIRAAWDETVVDVPAKEAWTETIIVSPTKEAWTEKVVAK